MLRDSNIEWKILEFVLQTVTQGKFLETATVTQNLKSRQSNIYLMHPRPLLHSEGSLTALK